jgi:hypothetical protein
VESKDEDEEVSDEEKAPPWVFDLLHDV